MTSTRSPDPVLSIRDLSLGYATDGGVVQVLYGVSLTVRAGETLGVVGESGSGKTQTVLSSLRLVPRKTSRILGGTVEFGGRDLLALRADELCAVRGRDIGFVFQDPMTSLNPVMRVGRQIGEAVRAHDRSVDKNALHARAIELLTAVGIAAPDRAAASYPHELSGGMRQRVGIAIAVANEPQVLIADEPTTALDVTIQAQVLDLLRSLQQDRHMALVLITHDLSVIAETAHRVVVMYAGRVVEVADTVTLFARPRHPYTIGLLRSRPTMSGEGKDTGELVAIPGQPPLPARAGHGCAFEPRCPIGRGRRDCRERVPELTDVDADHRTRCHYPDEVRTLAAEAGHA